MRPQEVIFQELCDASASQAAPDWEEIVIKFKVDEEQEEFFNTYLRSKGADRVEVSLPYLPTYRTLLEELREHLSTGGKEPFTDCTVRF